MLKILAAIGCLASVYFLCYVYTNDISCEKDHVTRIIGWILVLIIPVKFLRHEQRTKTFGHYSADWVRLLDPLSFSC